MTEFERFNKIRISGWWVVDPRSELITGYYDNIDHGGITYCCRIKLYKDLNWQESIFIVTYRGSKLDIWSNLSEKIAKSKLILKRKCNSTEIDDVKNTLKQVFIQFSHIIKQYDI